MNIPGMELEAGRAGGLAAIKFLIQILCSFWVISICYIQRKPFFVLNKQTAFFILYLIFCASSLLADTIKYSELSIVSWARLIVLSSLLPLTSYLANFNFYNRIRALFFAKFLVIFIVIAVALIYPEYAYRAIYNDNEIYAERLGGNIIPPNTLGGMCAILAILSFAVIKRHKLTLFFILINILILTQSRSALGCLAISICFFYFAPRIGVLNTILVSLALFFVAYSFYDTISSILPERFSQNTYSTSESSYFGREELWLQALNRITGSSFYHILIGFGFMLPNDEFIHGSLVTNTLHNGYLQVLYGTGIFGLISYIALWSSVVRNIKKITNRNERNTYATLILFLVLFNITELSSLVLMNTFTLDYFVGLFLISSRVNTNTRILYKYEAL